MLKLDLTQIDGSRHLLIAGPTASGKSALALAVAQAQGGLIVNADALVVRLAEHEERQRRQQQRHDYPLGARVCMVAP